MPLSREESLQVVSDFFEVKGSFADRRPEGMSASAYPRALADRLASLDDTSQSEVAGILIEYATSGSNALNRAAGYVSADLALRGAAKAFTAHVQKIEEWLETGLALGWWDSDVILKTAPAEAANAIQLINVLWCCDEIAAQAITDKFRARTSSQTLLASLAKSMLLPEVRRSMNETAE